MTGSNAPACEQRSDLEGGFGTLSNLRTSPLSRKRSFPAGGGNVQPASMNVRSPRMVRFHLPKARLEHLVLRGCGMAGIWWKAEWPLSAPIDDKRTFLHGGRLRVSTGDALTLAAPSDRDGDDRRPLELPQLGPAHGMLGNLGPCGTEKTWR